MFWIVTAAVLVVLAALAWWHGGRAKPYRDIQRGIDTANTQSRAQRGITNEHATNQPLP
jgi:hypothetical protein